MIVVRLQGGLGNQLFQYALALGMHAKTGQEFSFDLSFLEKTRDGVTPWPYMLGCMAFEVPVMPETEAKEFIRSGTSRWAPVLRAFGRNVPYFYSEIPLRFNPEVYDYVTDTYFNGFWQSEKYFEFIEKDIRTMYRLKDPLGREAEDLGERMDQENSVSVHIRRGDYTATKVSNTLGMCGPQYIEDALAELAAKVPAPELFIFSDDIEWARHNVTPAHPTTYVSVPGLPYYEELMLMARCRHHVIANSTFSWWGAWLDPRPDKIVVAPKPWFKDPKIDNRDTIPSTWIRIPTSL